MEKVKRGNLICIIYLSSENIILLYRQNDMNHLSNSAGLCATYRTHVDTIGCKIQGLRTHSLNPSHAETSSNQSTNPHDDGTREIKIFGCENCVSKECLWAIME